MNKSFQFAIRQSFVICGQGTAEQAPGLLTSLGGRRCVIFSDAVLEKLGFVEKIKSYFAAEPNAPEIVDVITNIEADARSPLVNEAYRAFKSKEADCVLTVGGGSVIDTAKAVLFMNAKGYDDVCKIFRDKANVEFFPTARRFTTPHIIIPTTAGTGSEVSTTAVIYDLETDLKSSIFFQYLGADCAILDAEFTATMPPFMTASTGFDALVHAWEAIFSKNANQVADAHALAAVKLICQNLKQATLHGDDLAARQNMLLGNSMGISAFGTTFGGVPIHAVGLALGAKYHVPHGLAMALLMAPIMRIAPEWYLPRIKEVAVAMGIEPAATNEECLEQVTAFIDQLRRDCGLGDKFRGIEHCTDEDILDITAKCRQASSTAYIDFDEVKMKQICQQVI